jgi:hypothetical protein
MGREAGTNDKCVEKTVGRSAGEEAAQRCVCVTGAILPGIRDRVKHVAEERLVQCVLRLTGPM